jgi:hypothetical protein
MKHILYKFICLFIITSSLLASEVVGDPIKNRNGKTELKNNTEDEGPSNLSDPDSEDDNLDPGSIEARYAAKKALYSAFQVREFNSLDAFSKPITLEDDPINEMIVGSTTDSVRYHVNRAHALLKEVLDNDKFTDIIDFEAVQNLPIAIKKKIGNIDYTIIIDSLVLTKKEAYLVAYMSLENPTNGKKLAFMGRNIRFTKTGGLTGDARLDLLEDFPIKIGSESLLTIKGGKIGSNNTFVEWDCNGFKSMSVSADVEFSRNMLVPENPDGSIGQGRVQGSFSSTINDWGDLIASVDLSPFQVTGIKGIGFYVKGAVFDFSELNNPPNLTFPEGYETAQMTDDNPNMWQGFYVDEMSVKLPPQFEDKEKNSRIEFYGYNLIIDKMGFTGLITGSNLLQYDKGSMDGWAFSVDSLSLSFQANNLKAAGFNGMINVPVFDKNSGFDYSALIDPGDEYIFNVSPQEDITMPLWKASDVVIYESSYLEIAVIDSKFRPKANINGKMTISTGDDGGVSLADITFEGFEIASTKPHIKVGNFSFGSEALEQKMSGFPISIKDIGMRSIGEKVGIDFDLVLNLVGDGDGGFGADAGLTIVGKMDDSEGWKSWKYDRLDINDITIDIDAGAYKLWGQLTVFKEHERFGTGIKGLVKAEFAPGIKVDATALFGSVDGYRYWYADGMIIFPTGIPIFPAIGIYGFGGGAFYHMRQKGFDEGGADLEIGRTVSGIIYLPDDKVHIGLKASVAIGTMPTAQVFNGDATFEITFNSHGGINSLDFTGNSYFITPPMITDLTALKEKVKVLSNIEPGINDELDKLSEKGQISAHMRMNYDIPNKTLHGVLKVYINVAGGLMRGTGPNNSAGTAVIHFSPGEWYIHIGTPDQRIGIEMMRMMKSEGYFMVGDNIPGSPPPPENVSRILGGMDLDYMRDENAIGLGKGIAFGSSFSMDTGDISFAMFYGRFAAGMGFDVMLKNYGDDVRCQGSGKIGVNGWYANGQAYGYLEGSIGIKVKLFFKTKKIHILSIGAAAVFQAKLPNPLWMRGVVGGRFSVLGGLVTGHCRFRVTIGEECKFTSGSILSGIRVIEEITPATGETDISVFNAPQALFNIQPGKVFELEDFDDKIKYFRLSLDYFKVMNGAQEIAGTLEWNDDHTVVAFNAFDVLPPKKELRAMTQVSFEESLSGGVWRKVTVNGKNITENKESKFTTGIAPDYIPLENVAYSYPAIGQYNFHKDESNVGYVKLKQGQPYLFDESNEWKQLGRISTDGGQKSEFNISYTDRQINYSMPSGLNNNSVYAFSIVNVPAKASSQVDQNIKIGAAKIETDETIDMEMKTQKAEGVIDILQEKVLLGTYFRTSTYSTFEAKFNTLTITSGWKRNIHPGVDELGATIYGAELFDKAEIQGTANAKPLIQFKAKLVDNPWLTDIINPLIYEGYPLAGSMTVKWRDPQTLGVPPLKAINIRQNPNDKVLEEAELNGSANANITDAAAFIYNLPFYMEKDYIEIQGQAANAYINSSAKSDRITKLLSTSFPAISKGNYKFDVKYVLPGANSASTTKEVNIINSINN